MSAASRTNESAMRSAPAFRPQRRSSSAGLQTPAEVLLVLLGEGGDAHGDTGQVDALVVGHRARDDGAGRDDRPVHALDLDAHLAVVDQEEIAGLDVVGQALERRAHEVARAHDVVGGDPQDVAHGEVVRAVAELSEADLRALQVDEDRDGAAGVLRGLAHIGETDLVLGVVAVAQVHAGHVDAGIDDRADHLVRLGGGAQGGDDLRASH